MNGPWTMTQTMPMKRRRHWARALLGYVISLHYGLFFLLRPAEINRIDSTSVRRRGDTNADHLSFRSMPYYRHIKFANHHSPNRTNSASSLVQQHHDNNNVRITFELHDPQSIPLQNMFNLYVTCPLGRMTTGKKKRTPTEQFRSGELPPSLKRVVDQQDMYGRYRSGRVLDFTVTISTNLKLLFIGDSVLVQLAQAFDEMVITMDKKQGDEQITNTNRKVLWESWHGHDGGTIVAPTRGGGVSALWRMTGLLSRSNKGKPPANSAGGGWSDTEIGLLTNHAYDDIMKMNTETPPMQLQQLGNSTTTVATFDVVILRVMHGWMHLHEITHDRLIEAVELSHTLFGATTVILMTVPFTNNIRTIEDMNKVNEINKDIRKISRDWHFMRELNVGGLGQVLVAEYGSYYNHILWSNGRHMGYNVTHPLRATQFIFDTEGPGMLLDRLQDAGEWPPSIPMVCNDTALLGPERRTCHRNYLFLDGMHVCPETLASRFAAGVACLLGCVYNNNDREANAARAYENDKGTTVLPSEDNIRACESECNEQFLSVMPVDESLIDAFTLASFAG